jgi:hypothetical protein
MANDPEQGTDPFPPRYLAIEVPDRKAIVDFLGSHASRRTTVAPCSKAIGSRSRRRPGGARGIDPVTRGA